MLGKKTVKTNKEMKTFVNKKENPAQLLKLEFAACTPQRASYLLGCLGAHNKASHTAGGGRDAPVLEKLPGVLKPARGQEHPLDDAPDGRGEGALRCPAPQGPTMTRKHLMIATKATIIFTRGIGLRILEKENF